MVFTWRGKADPFRFEKETGGGPSAFEAEGTVLFVMKREGAIHFPKGKNDKEYASPFSRRHDVHLTGES